MRDAWNNRTSGLSSRGRGHTATAGQVVQKYKIVKAECVKLEQALMRVDAFKLTGDPTSQETLKKATLVYLGKVEVGKDLYRL